MKFKKHSKYLRPVSSLLSGLLLVIATLVPTIANATIYYVATNGNNSNSGTESQPFKTINKGVPLLSPGDTLYIKAGTYTEAVDNWPSGTSWGNAITVAGFPGDTVILKPNGSGNPVLNFDSSSDRYIIVDNLILDATNTGQSVAAVGFFNGHHIRIQNSEIKNATRHGVYSFGDNNEFIGVNIHDNGLNDDISHGIYIEANYNLIENCDVHHNGHMGIQLYTEGYTADDNIVRNNRVHDNGQYKAGAEIVVGGGGSNIVYNNLIYDGSGEGITVGWGSGVSNNKVYNNTIYNVATGIRIISGSKNTDVQNNIIYNAGRTTWDEGNNSNFSNNLSSDPRFENSSAKDFHLKSTSGAIDAGILVNEFDVDIDGTPRPQGTSYDIGAYEFSSTPPDNTPPQPPQNLAFTN